MKKTGIISLGLLVCVTTLTIVESCSKDNVVDYYGLGNCTDTVSFAAKIEPLINANCATSGCHDATTAESGYDFTTHQSIADNAEIMYNAMSWQPGTAPMPDGGDQLTDSLIQQFSCWMSQGKLNN
ncbi:MAG: hypothetical protein A3D31_05935 [Candidatus Fluviicola riflensis]|nr:MAG: hypothetical protein CHH17_09080 [Candidatus Fluviicola riflensis]OGS79505.1 MAG: hypothetical protein A3D31_05935 [Candidatus Fluviicola riflensis]OGS86936.1 MAG: hypothetical protein A2724_05395 [Fluviicola sp. RIFCSPHIGHO2_01_FULL_43_53]OGS89727.1 MAG: hypothetical protein A3E30_02140 [Fluviicola sp. RIFCSPHIGHO2_12_FULL_43_24]